ncbi:fibrinogen alpha chain-like [Stegostoma tigrinum]|uniref:fibrinogen alpha chain-like n=1 Tax=Stegostoma tigrinum TaxID=3053191 RepID=UPI00286FE0B9|nr:fibrinogen alpha chain-like [Stegostoma tigrinum]XP_048400464.2 fibrinogen alpha chain-like [Stegostoma tigrinum]
MKAVLSLGLILCFIGLTRTTVLQPRGPRPVGAREESRSRQCLEQAWPICTDEDWGPKCPSGCRMQGLIDTQNQQNENRIREIRRMLDMYSKTFQNTHITVTEAINRIRQTLNGIGRFGNTYHELVDRLNIRLINLQKRVDDQIARVNTIKNNIIEQYNEISRLEVDIDIKIRACKGSCAQSFVYSIDRKQNAQIEKNLKSMASHRVEKIQHGKPTRIFKMRIIKESPVSSHYKSLETKNVPETTEYPVFWHEADDNMFILEQNTNDPSVSETSRTSSSTSSSTSIKSSSKTSSKTSSSTSSKTSSRDKGASEFSHPDRNILHPDGSFSGAFNFSSNFDHDSLYGTHFTNRSVTTRTIISKDGKITETVTTQGESSPLPFSMDALLAKYGIDGKTKGFTTTLTKTSTSSHNLGDFESLLNPGIKSSGHETVVHTKTVTTTGESSDFENMEDLSRDLSSLSHRDVMGTPDEVGGSRKTVVHERTVQRWSSSGGSKGFKGTADFNHDVARLSEDETGGSDPSIKTFQREQ